MTDADALEQVQTWLYSGVAGETAPPTEAIARVLTLALASLANTTAFTQASEEAETYSQALAMVGITGGEVNGERVWWHVRPDTTEQRHASVHEAAMALWHDYTRERTA
jgi:hypothetical protein